MVRGVSEIHSVVHVHRERGRDWPRGGKAAGNSAPQSIVIVSIG